MCVSYFFIFCLGKACTQIQQPAHSVAIGTSNFVGDNVVFVCDPGYRMLGTSAVTCVDQKGFAVWSDRTPFCIRRFKRSACKWKHLKCYEFVE